MSDDEYDEIVCLFKNKSRQLAIKKRKNRGWGVSEWTWPILCFCFVLKPPAKTFEFVQEIRFCPMHHRRSLHSGIGKKLLQKLTAYFWFLKNRFKMNIDNVVGARRGNFCTRAFSEDHFLQHSRLNSISASYYICGRENAH